MNVNVNDEEEKEEVQPLELEVPNVQEILSNSEDNMILEMDEEDSVVPPLQGMSSYRNNQPNMSSAIGQRMNVAPTKSSAGITPHRLQRLPNSQGRFSGYANGKNNHSVARKPSLASVSEKSMDDSSNMSLPSFSHRRNTTFTASTSSSSNASEAVKFTASRIARNMSLYMRAGALPVAATVVDAEDELEAELREKLEIEIRQELEIEMEEFRRQLVLQMVGAAQPVTANVISVQPGSIMDGSSSLLDISNNAELQRYAEALDLTLDNDRAYLQAAREDRERAEAAAVRSSTNREIGRLYLQMKSQRSFGVLNPADDNVEDAFYDPETAKVVRARARQNHGSPSWNVFWVALAATLIGGVLLGVGIVVGVYESRN
jgi:hypothetical protein